MPKYDILLFDADQTLLDFRRSEKEAVIDCFNGFSIPTTDDNIKLYSSINDFYWKMLERGEIEKSKLLVERWRTFGKKCGLDFDAEKMSSLYLENLSHKSYVINGATEICERLSEFCRLYIITNGNKKVQNGRFAKLKLSEYFKDRFISEDIGYEKPNIRFFKEVEKRIENFDRERSLVIGDSLTSDIMGGINAGIDTCWYNPDGRKCPDNIKINYTVQSLSEIEEIVL